MAIEADKVWLDGELVDFASANIHILTHTLHYGLGAFEGIRCYERSDGRAAIFRLRDHIRRLVESCKIVTIDCPWSIDQLCEACVETVKANGFKDCYLRPLIFLGHGEMGLSAMSNAVRGAVVAWKWGAYLGDEGLNNGIRAKVATFERFSVNALMSKGKICGHYVNSILAKREAMADGYSEAIMLDAEGYIAEAAGENVFAIRDGKIFTTPLNASILHGITRDTIAHLARERGHTIIEQRMTRDFLYIADEVFMVGTAAEVTPVREIDRRVIGEGRPGPVTQELQQAYFELVKGAATGPESWLTYVE